MSAYTIRPLSRVELVKSIDDFIAVAKDVPGEYWSREHFLLELPEKWRLSLAAWIADRPVGYAIISRKSESVAHLHHFMVVPDQRGKGLGEAMLEKAIRKCVGGGCSEMTLKVAAESKDAQRFYRRNDFETSGEPGPYLLMRRAIAP